MAYLYLNKKLSLMHYAVKYTALLVRMRWDGELTLPPSPKFDAYIIPAPLYVFPRLADRLSVIWSEMYVSGDAKKHVKRRGIVRK